MSRSHVFGIVGGYGATGSAVANALLKSCNGEILIGGRDLKHRSKLDCRRLIMTHMSEDLLHRLDEAKIEAAKDGSIVAL